MRRVLAQEELDQNRYVFSAIPQRRQAQANSINPVVKLRAKTPRADFIVQIPARRRNYSRPECSAMKIAVSVRQRVQQAALAGQVQFTDFVEYNGSGGSRVSISIAACAQTKLCRKLRWIHGGTHDIHELLVAACRKAMQPLGEHCFPSSTFARKQHGYVGSRNLGDDRFKGVHRGTHSPHEAPFFGN
ncbi:MAG: hypothetical protein WBY24_00840 [Candidatus Acidiferrales bacterium]